MAGNFGFLQSLKKTKLLVESVPLGWRLYRLVTILGSPVWRFFLWIRVLGKKELSSRLPERLGISSLKRCQGKFIWFHGASAGESVAALNLMMPFVHKDPDCRFLITTGTVAGITLLEKRIPYLDPNLQDRLHVQVLPLDVPKAITRFLDFWKPKGAIFIEADYWPNLWMESYKRNCPIVLLSGRLSEKSLKRWSYIRKYFCYLMNLTLVRTVSGPSFKERFKKLGLEMLVIPSVKYRLDPPVFQQQTLNQLKNALEGRQCWFASCIHKGTELEYILDAHGKLLKKNPGLLLILAPRRMEQLREILHWCNAYGLSYHLRSRHSGTLAISRNIYIVDTMGEMGLFYALSPVCFIGGSFVPLGGHNVIEGIHMDSAILHGPFMDNQEEMVEAFQDAGAIRCVNTAAELLESLEFLLSNPEKCLEMARGARQIIEKKQKELDHFIEHLADMLLGNMVQGGIDRGV
jgi:3-deoxy-D-manno-octulosonic-acid transferase